jgi:hypothetical protein
VSVRATALLALLAAALAAYVYFVEVRGAREKADTEQEAKRILRLEADSVTALEMPLEDGGGTARLERDPADFDRWHLAAPIEYPADSSVVSGILSTLTGLESEEVIEDPPEDLTPFGLAEDAPTLRVSLKEGESRVLRLGEKTPLGSSRYLQLEGDPRLFTVEDWRTSTLRPTLRTLRDKRIVGPEPEEVTALRILERGTLLAHLRRLERGSPEEAEAPSRWEIVEPIADAGDARRIERLLQDLRFLRAMEFVDEPGPLAGYGLDTPEVTLELLAGEKRARLELGRKLAKVYLRASGQPAVFEVPERALADIPRELFSYREKQVLRIDEQAARRIELRFPRDEVSYAFVREENRWKAEEEEVQVDSLRLEDLLYAIRDLEATGIEERSLDPGELGLVPPGVRVTIQDGEGKELGWLELGNPTLEAGIAARSSGNDRLWRVANGLGEDLPLSLEAFQNNFVTGEPDEKEPTQDEGERREEDREESDEEDRG